MNGDGVVSSSSQTKAKLPQRKRERKRLLYSHLLLKISLCFMNDFDMSGGYNEELSALCSRLWDLDKRNRLVIGQNYRLNPQGCTYSSNTEDRADNPLFQWVDPSVFQRETYRAFVALLDNYEKSTGVPETVTPEEERENWTFINSIMSTPVMKETHAFLCNKGLVPADVNGFKNLLYKMWFHLYSRRSGGARNLDSSGFEHVFVGETRGSDVLGFHNWIQFYLQEKHGHVNYYGYIASRGQVLHDNLMSIKFSWKNDVKAIGSSFIGTSPEFEVALYTTCFLASTVSNTRLKIHDMNVEIVCHKIVTRDGTHIGTSYPSVIRH